MRFFGAIVFTVLLVSYSGAGSSKEFKQVIIEPQDKSGSDLSLKVFIDELKSIVQEKDIEGLKSVCAKDIFYSKAEKPGIAGFIEYFGLDEDPGDPFFWNGFEQILSRGGDFAKGSKNAYLIPYWYGAFPQVMDAVKNVCAQPCIANMKNTPVYKNPDKKGKILKSVSYEVLIVLQYTPGDDNNIYYKVRTYGGMEGYVLAENIYLEYSLHATLKKINGKWKIAELTKG